MAVQTSQKPRLDPQRPSGFARALTILVAFAAFAFSPVLAAAYLRLDDYRHILENPDLQSTSLSSLARFWTNPYFGLYIPVTYSMWWLLAAIAHTLGLLLKQSAWLFHALNLVLHLANSGLVFLVVQKLLRRCRPDGAELDERSMVTVSLIAGLFFALHPVQVETVAWISECKGELSLLLGLLGIWSYYRPTKRYVTAILLVAAMLAKPSSIVFPGILLLTNRILLGQSLKASAAMPALLWTLLLPLAIVTKHLQPDSNMDFVPGFAQRLFVAFDALGFYAAKLIVPFPLALDYGRSPTYVLAHVEAWRIILSTVVVLWLLGPAVYAMVRRQPGHGWFSFVACGSSVFALALVPILGFVPFEFQDFSTVADHYMYIAIFGGALAVAGLLCRFRQARKVAAIASVVLLVLAALSFRQATAWRSTETLFEHTLEVNPQSYLAHYSIAAELMDRGRLDLGIAHNLKSLEINPDYLYAEMALGVGWIRKGELQKAIDHYTRVLAHNPSSVGKRAALMGSIHNNLGTALHQVGRHAEGTQQFRKAVAVDPGSVSGYLNLASAAFNEGRYLDAIAEYQRALVLSPGNVPIEQGLVRARRAAQMNLR